MKQGIRTFAALTITTMLSAIATTASADQGDISISVKFGQTSFSRLDELQVFEGVSAKEELAMGFNLGYSFSPKWTAEIEHVSGGVSVTLGGEKSEFDMRSTGAYAAYRSEGNLYFQARIGLVNYERDVGDNTLSEIFSSFGAGGGYNVLSNLAVELDYTIVEGDTSWIVLSGRYFIR